MSLSHFDEKSGFVSCPTPWGYWYQTVGEIQIEIRLPRKCKAKELKVVITNNSLNCSLGQTVLVEGELYKTIHPDESMWVLEDSEVIQIILSKATCVLWASLLKDGSFSPDPLTLHEMRKKLDLESFQIENPGMDFSSAKLQKCYDTIGESQ